MKRIIGFLILAASMGSLGSQGQDLSRQKRRLEAEAELAKAPAVYLVVDSGAREISLRARGLTLKSWKAKSIRSWGRPVGIGSLKVVKRTGWSAQDRVNLTPGLKPEESKDDKKPRDIGDDVLEIGDMPARYQFALEGDVELAIRPKPRGFFGQAAARIGSIGGAFGRSLQIVGRALRGRSFSRIRVIVPDPTAAQGLFWSVPEGTKVLFI
jgi:hypothetical protein